MSFFELWCAQRSQLPQIALLLRTRVRIAPWGE